MNQHKILQKKFPTITASDKQRNTPAVKANIHSLVDSFGARLDIIRNPMKDINDEKLIRSNTAQLLKPELIKMAKSPFF